MQVQITGKHIDVGDALRTHVSEKLDAAVDKYLDRATEAIIVFSKEGHEFRTDCTIRLGHNITLKTQGQAGDIYASFDSAAERLEKRLRRHKRRLKDHHAAGKAAPEEFEIPSRVLASDGGEGEEQEGDQPVIVAETTTRLQRLSVGEAVMRMDLSDAPFFLFRSGADGEFNIVYRRDDGNIGWVELKDRQAGK